MGYFAREFTYPSNNHGSPSGTPEVDTNRLGGNTIDSVIRPLEGNIVILKADIKTAIPSITDPILTSEFMLKFISGGMPLMIDDTTGDYIFNEEALKTPQRVICNRGLGMAAANSYLISSISENATSFYIKSNTFMRENLALFGRDARFKMQVGTVPLDPAGYSKGTDTGVAPFPLPTDADLKKLNTVTADYSVYVGTKVKDNSLKVGDIVSFDFDHIGVTPQWIVKKSATPDDDFCQITAINSPVDTTGNNINAFGHVTIKFKKFKI